MRGSATTKPQRLPARLRARGGDAHGLYGGTTCGHTLSPPRRPPDGAEPRSAGGNDATDTYDGMWLS